MYVAVNHSVKLQYNTDVSQSALFHCNNAVHITFMLSCRTSDPECRADGFCFCSQTAGRWMFMAAPCTRRFQWIDRYDERLRNKHVGYFDVSSTVYESATLQCNFRNTVSHDMLNSHVLWRQKRKCGHGSELINSTEALLVQSSKISLQENILLLLLRRRAHSARINQTSKCK